MKNKVFKNILVYFSVSAIIVSCGELDLDQGEFNPPAGEFELVSDFSASVTGIYAALNNGSRKTTYYIDAWAGDDITTASTLFSDGVTTFANNKEDFREFDQRSVRPTNSRLIDHWNDNFKVIRNANFSIQNGSTMVERFPDEEESINALTGEAHFLRALAYHKMLRMHNRVPIIESLDPVLSGLELPSRAETYSYIEADLKRAIELLPNVNNGPLGNTTVKGHTRPGKGSAKAILARLYMDWAGYPVEDVSKYSEAAKLAKEVIAESADYNFQLMDNVGDLWLLANRFNDESVFSLAYVVQTANNASENQKFGAVGNSGANGGWDETYAEIRFFEDFPEGPRKDGTYLNDLDWISEFADRQQSPLFRKITGPVERRGRRTTREIAAGTFKTNRSDFIMRYAEVFLIHAEASARSGNPSAEAWESLNVIRRRSYDPATTKIDLGPGDGDLAELAVTERKWEFAGEYQRWNDLVRLKLVKDALSNRNPQVSRNADNELIRLPNEIISPESTLELSTANYFHTLPEQIISANPNLQE